MSNQYTPSPQDDPPIYMAGRDIVINNYAAPNTPPATQSGSTVVTPATSTPTLWQRIKNIPPKTRANVAIWFGAAMAICVSITAASFGEAISAVFTGSAFIVPGLWWHYCQRRDEHNLIEHAQQTAQIEQSRALLDDTADAVVLQYLTPPPKPAPVRRHWLAIGMATLTLATIGSVFYEEPAPTPAPSPATQQHQQQHNM